MCDDCLISDHVDFAHGPQDHFQLPSHMVGLACSDLPQLTIVTVLHKICM